jgi:hypothetical protein
LALAPGKSAPDPQKFHPPGGSNIQTTPRPQYIRRRLACPCCCARGRARAGLRPAQKPWIFLAAKERKERKEKIRILPIKAPFSPEAVFFCVLCG